MNVEEEIRKHADMVSTQSYSMSVGEMVYMYRDGELDLHPDFQRFFRWTPEQKSRLIESLLLGIPIPPIFVTERKDSKWDVIDGLQRLSTFAELLGELRDEDDKVKEALVLTRTRYLPGLEGKRWESDNPDQELPESTRIKIKRGRLNINIVNRAGDEIAKHEIFQRLNTGGAKATEQEIRNCILIMTNRNFYKWIEKLAKYEHFQMCLTLTERALKEKFDMELVARFIVMVTSSIKDLDRIDEFGSFLTDELTKRATDSEFDMDAVAGAFKQTFDILAESLKENSFRKYDGKKKRYLGAMLISLFEIVAAGLGYLLLHDGEPPKKRSIQHRHRILWKAIMNENLVLAGDGASTRIPKTIEFGRRWLKV